MNKGMIIDFDDTLVETTVFFELSRNKFVRLMTTFGFPQKDVLDTLDLMDIENVKEYGGFYKECFPHAMVRTYEHFCNLNKTVADPAICRKVEDLGWWVFKQKPLAVPEVCEVLEALTVEYDLFLATKGDPSVQWQRIRESGIKGYFKKIYVLKDKKKEEYISIASENNLEPGYSWVVGNSIKSDINPGILAGFNCIFIPNKHTWHFEMEEPVGKYITLKSLNLVPELLLKKSFFTKGCLIIRGE